MYVKQIAAEASRVDFIVETNGPITGKIKGFYFHFPKILTYLRRPDLVSLISDLIPGDKTRVPLQAADVLGWHLQRKDAHNLDSRDAWRIGRLVTRRGFEHKWEADALSELAERLINGPSEAWLRRDAIA
jgi:hypothetical protein